MLYNALPSDILFRVILHMNFYIFFQRKILFLFKSSACQLLFILVLIVFGKNDSATLAFASENSQTDFQKLKIMDYTDTKPREIDLAELIQDIAASKPEKSEEVLDKLNAILSMYNSYAPASKKWNLEQLKERLAKFYQFHQSLKDPRHQEALTFFSDHVVPDQLNFGDHLKDQLIEHAKLPSVCEEERNESNNLVPLAIYQFFGNVKKFVAQSETAFSIGQENKIKQDDKDTLVQNLKRAMVNPLAICLHENDYSYSVERTQVLFHNFFNSSMTFSQLKAAMMNAENTVIQLPPENNLESEFLYKMMRIAQKPILVNSENAYDFLALVHVLIESGEACSDNQHNQLDLAYRMSGHAEEEQMVIDPTVVANWQRETQTVSEATAKKIHIQFKKTLRSVLESFLSKRVQEMKEAVREESPYSNFDEATVFSATLSHYAPALGIPVNASVNYNSDFTIYHLATHFDLVLPDLLKKFRLDLTEQGLLDQISEIQQFKDLMKFSVIQSSHKNEDQKVDTDRGNQEMLDYVLKTYLIRSGLIQPANKSLILKDLILADNADNEGENLSNGIADISGWLEEDDDDEGMNAFSAEFGDHGVSLRGILALRREDVNSNSNIPTPLPRDSLELITQSHPISSRSLFAVASNSLRAARMRLIAFAVRSRPRLTRRPSHPRPPSRTQGDHSEDSLDSLD
jgi:hypothetical protein